MATLGGMVGCASSEQLHAPGQCEIFDENPGIYIFRVARTTLYTDGMLSSEATVFVVDDDAHVRRSIALLVDSTQRKTRCFESASEFLAEFQEDFEGCLVLDLKMPEIDGLQLLSKLHEREFHLPVIFISGCGEIPQVVKAIKSGAIDFLEKPYRATDLLDCIDTALSTDARKREERLRVKQRLETYHALSAEERAVLNGIVAGRATKELATELEVSLRTIQFRRESIMKKFNVNSRAELVSLIVKLRDSGP